MNGQGAQNLTAWIPDIKAPDGGNDTNPVWASNADSIVFLGSHKTWGSQARNIYLTSVDKPLTLLVVSDVTTGTYRQPGWEGSDSILYFSSHKLFYYDNGNGKRTTAATMSLIGDQYTLDPAEVYIGTAKGIYAVKWRTGASRLVGPGINPDLP